MLFKKDKLKVKSISKTKNETEKGILSKEGGENLTAGASNGSVVLAILIGAFGGFVFAFLKMPLPWMLGAMVFVTTAALFGVPVRLPNILRQIMVVFIGVMLGSQFSPNLIQRIDDWIISVGSMLVYGIIAMAIVLFYLKRFGNYGIVTAYFSASPGGLNDMTIIGREMGGDDRVIALTHASRILLVVITIPFMFRIFGNYEPSEDILPDNSDFHLPFREWIMMLFCITVGPFIARLLHLPAAFLLGALALTAATHILGWSSASPPALLTSAAQIILGTAVGCRFAGTNFAEVLTIIRVSIGSTIILMSTAVGAGFLLTDLTGLPWYMITLAYAPGGLAEMSLVAIGIGQDVAFVATHHLFRIAAVVLLAPVAFKFLKSYFLNP